MLMGLQTACLKDDMLTVSLLDVFKMQRKDRFMALIDRSPIKIRFNLSSLEKTMNLTITIRNR